MWYSVLLSVWLGATTMESPVCTPRGSKFCRNQNRTKQSQNKTYRDVHKPGKKCAKAVLSGGGEYFFREIHHLDTYINDLRRRRTRERSMECTCTAGKAGPQDRYLGKIIPSRYRPNWVFFEYHTFDSHDTTVYRDVNTYRPNPIGSVQMP